MEIQKKRAMETLVVRHMIALYCRKKHHTRGTLCSACNELTAYVKRQTANCPFMETKTFCSQCKVHCYRQDMRTRIREIMRFSGTRMLLRHPILVLWHGMETLKGRKR